MMKSPKKTGSGNRAIDFDLNPVAFADDPMATKEARQGRLGQREINRATVGAGVRIAGALPVIEQGLHLRQRKRCAISDRATASRGYDRRFQIPLT
jgi:hypothetical protein